MLVAAADDGRDPHRGAARDHAAGSPAGTPSTSGSARIVQYEFRNLTPEHREAVLGLRKEIDAVVRDVVTAGVASASSSVDDVPETTLALLSMAVDVARWYDPEIKRTPEAIGLTYGDLGLRLVAAARHHRAG